MGKSAGSPPPAPDPTVTANAQTASNIATARKTAELNRVNQVGPTGSITYSQGAAPIDRNAWINNMVEAERAKWTSAHPAGSTPGYNNSDAYGAGGGDQGGYYGAGGGATGAGQAQMFDEAGTRARYDAMPTPDAPGQDTWTQTTKLSPEQQKLYDLTVQGQTTYGETANNLLNNTKDQLSQPVNTDWDAERSRLLAAQRARLDPYYSEQEEGLRQRLRNSGLTEGSEGWNREFRNFNQGRNDALVAADLRAGDTVGQGIQQTAALRGMPLNEASALLSGSQVQIPQLQQTAGANVAPTDVIGATNGTYQNNLAAWSAQNQQNAATTGGLFGLAGTLGGAAMRYGPGLFALSDARAKKDILPIGKAHNGLPLYAFRYRGDDKPQIGLMAQDVEKVNPGAVVTTASGLKAVDYGRALSNV
jgi:hypothetical protein